MVRIAIFLPFLLSPVGLMAEVSAAVAELPGAVQAELVAESQRAERQAAARPMELAGAYYSVAHGDDLVLYLVSMIAEPVLVEAAVASPEGERLPLGTYLVEPERHLAVPLAGQIRAAEPRFHQGTLSLRFLGDPDTLQGWVVLRRGRQVLELPMALPFEVQGWQYSSFWDTPAGGEAAPRYYLFNAGNQRIRYQVRFGRGPAELAASSGEIEPGAQRMLSPAGQGNSLQRGWLDLRHEGEPGALIAVGLLEGPDTLLPLAWISAAEAVGEREQHVLRLPTRSPVAGRAKAEDRLTLFNPGEKAVNVEISLLDLESGSPLATASAGVGPRHVHSVDLSHWLQHPRAVEARLSLRSEQPFQAWGFSRMAGGETVDWTIFPASAAHGSGSYPLPSPVDAQTHTTIVNLGVTEARVVAQVYWNGGTYSVGPITLPAGGAHRFDFAELALSGPADILGRKLDPSHTGGYFKWLAQEGSRELIARTEVQPRGMMDQFGFNCFGCCFETPSGVVVPGTVEFLLGQTQAFAACVQYSTCSGTMGPYDTDPTSLTSPAPFSWNGSTVSATGIGEEYLTFQGQELEIRFNCAETTRQVYGSGVASTCKEKLRKSHNPSEFWSASAACTQQVGDRPVNMRCGSCQGCCNAQAAFWTCKKRAQWLVQQELQACLTHCQTDQC